MSVIVIPNFVKFGPRPSELVWVGTGPLKNRRNGWKNVPNYR